MGESKNSRIVTKWVGFITAIWVQSISGNNYTFANYSADLKRIMNYTQMELNGLGVAKDIGKSVGILAGFLSDFLPPQVILMIGATVGALGYGTTWLVVSERIAPPSFWQMCIVVFMGGNSSTWMNTAVLVTCMRNFARSRGTVSGILKGFVGLSTAIFTVLCASLFTGDSSAFLLLLVFLPAGICLIAAIFLREVPVSTGEREDSIEQTSFAILNVIALLLSLYLLSYTFLAPTFTPLASKIFALGLLLFVISPVVVPGRMFFMSWLDGSGSPNKGAGKEIDESKEPLLSNGDAEKNEVRKNDEGLIESAEPTENNDTSSKARAGESSVEAEYVKSKLGDNYSYGEIFTSTDFWILFLDFLSAIGTGMAVINNMGQMGEALGYSDVSVFVSFFSIFGFFGRISAGAVSEHFVRTAALPRPVWMAGSKVFMILGYLALAWGIPGSLQFGSAVVGLCYGIHMTIVVATSSEMFGLKSFGITYNVLVLNIPLGSFLFSGLAGFLYDREAIRVGVSPHNSYTTEAVNFMSLSEEATKCYGAHCYRTLFIVMSSVLAVGMVFDLILILRLRPVFQKLYGPKLPASRSGEPSSGKHRQE